jgi:glutamate racemase
MLVEETLRPFASSGIDTVLLGCTHFELLEQQIRMILPSANIVASSQAVCEALEDRLDQRKIKNNDSKRGILRVYVTGNQENFERSIKWFNKPINVLEHIDIKNRC